MPEPEQEKVSLKDLAVPGSQEALKANGIAICQINTVANKVLPKAKVGSM